MIKKCFGPLAWTILAAVLCCPAAQAEQNMPSISQTKNKLKQLDAQINTLKYTLTNAQDKRGTLIMELGRTEKQIGADIAKMRSIKRDMAGKEEKIKGLEQHIQTLTAELTSQQDLLAQHIKTRYKMGEYRPLKWLLNQDDPYSISRLFSYYQYLVQSRQSIIANIDGTKKNLLIDQESLKNELAAQQDLQQQLQSHQQQLEQTKQYHKEVIEKLNQEIQSKEHMLEEAQRNKNNLAVLLNTLASQSDTLAKRPFNTLKHKLPHPVNAKPDAVQRLNQGVTFFAGEGTAVNAVYSGRVVFSDWLNGYGLLMIIDHGQGFMTLYAHNQSLFKRKGVTVFQGETIATVGHSGGLKQNGLYFEVRQRGKAVSPLEWLA